MTCRGQRASVAAFIRQALKAIPFALTTCLVHAQAVSGRLSTGEDIVTLPGMGRIFIVFLLVAALAVGIAMLIRRYVPKFGVATPASAAVRILDKTNVTPSLRVYVLKIDDSTVLLAEGRSGVSMIELRTTKGEST